MLIISKWCGVGKKEKKLKVVISAEWGIFCYHMAKIKWVLTSQESWTGREKCPRAFATEVTLSVIQYCIMRCLLCTYQVWVHVWKTANLAAVYPSRWWNTTYNSTVLTSRLTGLACLNKTNIERVRTLCIHLLHALKHTVQGAWWITSKI